MNCNTTHYRANSSSVPGDPTITRRHNLTGPQGVRGRNSDNSRLERELGWQPSIKLDQGLAITYKWIEGEVRKSPKYAKQLDQVLTPAG